MKKQGLTLTRTAAKLLMLGLSIISLYLIYIIAAILMQTNTSVAVLRHIFTPQIEHILMSLFLIVGGSLLLDLSIKEINKE